MYKASDDWRRTDGADDYSRRALFHPRHVGDVVDAVGLAAINYGNRSGVTALHNAWHYQERRSTV